MITTIDGRYTDDKEIGRWLLPLGIETVRKSKVKVLFNSLDYTVEVARQKAMEFEELYESGKIHKISTGRNGIIGVITNAIPNGINVNCVYKNPDVKFHNVTYSKDIYKFIFSQTRGVPCVITQNRNNLCVDWVCNGVELHMVLRKVKSSVNPAKLLYKLREEICAGGGNLSCMRAVTKIIINTSEGVFK